MIWKNWNKADKTLLAAAAIFFFSLCLHLQYPQSTFGSLLLFCSEAALVGGIADWFAVTALFRKPLGFPYHTAILPRRRQSFIDATGRMLQKEFFSKKKLLGKVRTIEFNEKVASFMEEPEQQEKAAKKVVDYIEAERQRHSSQIAEAMLRFISHVDPQDLLAKAGDVVRHSSESNHFIASLMGYLCVRAEEPQVKQIIYTYFNNYKEAKMQSLGAMALMMAGLAETTNLINIEEAAELTHTQIIELLHRFADEDTDEHRALHEAISDVIVGYSEPEFKPDVQGAWDSLLTQDTMENIVRSISLKESGLTDVIYHIVGENMRRWAEQVRTNPKLASAVNEIFYELAARGVLQAQDMLGDIVRDILATMTDEQLNHLVYDKAEPDLLWIRMNGSIVGASIGLVMFFILHLTGVK